MINLTQEIGLAAYHLATQFQTESAIAVGISAAAALPATFEQKPIAKLFQLATIAGITVGPCLMWVANTAAMELSGKQVFSKNDFLQFGLIALASFIGYVGVTRLSSPVIEAFLQKLRCPSLLERIRHEDAREIHKALSKKVINFDPRKYFHFKKGFFAGLDENCRPIYLNWKDIDEQHVAVEGPTRFGKGVFIQSSISQQIQRGSFVVVLDPKPDQWLGHVAREACKNANRPFHFIDLNAPEFQINLFQRATESEIRELLTAGLSLEELGHPTDFYKAEQQDQVETIAFEEALKSPTFAGIFKRHSKRLRDVPKNGARGLETKLRQLSRLKSVNATGGPNLAELVQQGGCVYVTGSMTDRTVIRAQRMLLLRLIQIGKKRNFEAGKDLPMHIIVDEARVFLSNINSQALATAAGFGTLLTLAFQSEDDLRNVPQDLDKDSMVSSVKTNCQVRLLFKQTGEAAEKAAASSGQIDVDIESRAVNRNLYGVEKFGSERHVQQQRTHFIDSNVFQNLPPRCGVLFEIRSLPRLCFTSPITVKKELLNITAYPGEELNCLNLNLDESPPQFDLPMEDYCNDDH